MIISQTSWSRPPTSASHWLDRFNYSKIGVHPRYEVKASLPEIGLVLPLVLPKDHGGHTGRFMEFRISVGELPVIRIFAQERRVRRRGVHVRVIQLCRPA
jgi:hypothetical protein